MDPEATLDALLDLMADPELKSQLSRDRDRVQMCHLMQHLQEWFRRGGFVPAVTRTGPKSYRLGAAPKEKVAG